MAIAEMFLSIIIGLAMLFIILLIIVGGLSVMLLVYCCIKLFNDFYHLRYRDL